MGNEKMSRESREAALERILAETAGASEYRPTRPARPVKPAAPVKETLKPETEEKQMTEAEKAEAAKIRAAQKIAEIKKRKELEEQRAAQAAMKKAPQPAVKREVKAEPANEEIESVRPGVKVRKPKKRTNAQLLEENMQETAFLQEAEENEENKPKSSVLQDILDIFECVISAVFVVILVFTYLFQIASVNGESMEPTLSGGDRLVVTAFGYEPECGDVVVVSGENSHLLSEDGEVLTDTGLEKNIIKRIVATEGQTIDFDFENGIVYVDGQALEESYISDPTKRDEYAFTYPLTIPKGYVFVLGDNRNISKDSRHPDVGLVADEDIIGKVLLRVYPFEKFGTIE